MKLVKMLPRDVIEKKQRHLCCNCWEGGCSPSHLCYSAIGIRIFVPLNTKLKVKQTEKSNHVQSILPGERKQTEMCAQNRLSQGAEYWGNMIFTVQ